MKKYYIICDKKGCYKGFTDIKEFYELFCQQRPTKDYNFIISNEKDLNPKLKESLTIYEELVWNSGMILFPSEEEYYIESLNQFFIDVRRFAGYITEKLKYLRMEDEDKRVILEALSIMENNMNEADNVFYDEEVAVEYEKYLNVKGMIGHIIDSLN
jgi:hypothetical protein